MKPAQKEEPGRSAVMEPTDRGEETPMKRAMMTKEKIPSRQLPVEPLPETVRGGKVQVEVS